MSHCPQNIAQITRQLRDIVAAALLLGACSTGPDEDPNLVDQVEVQPAQHTLSLGVDDVVQLNASARNRAGAILTDKSVSWRSGAAGVATVSSAGAVTAVGLGTATIIATVDGVEGTATITVNPPPVATVTLSLGQPVMVAGGSASAMAVLRDAGGHELSDRQVSFASSDELVATVSAQGLVSAIAAGTSMITATSEGKAAAVTLCVLGSAPNFRIDDVLLSQAVQRPAGDIPLVSGGLPAEVQVFATNDVVLPAGCQPARIRMIVLDGQTEIVRDERDVSGPLPLVVNTQFPVARFILASEWITPTMRLLVEVDPHDLVPESNASDNAWPASGQPGQVAVTAVPPLQIRFVPILLNNGGSTGQVTDFDMDEYLYATRQLYPVAEIQHDIGETMATNAVYGNGEQGPFIQMLQELDLKRVAEATRRYYVGAVRPPPAVAFTQLGGIGYVPFNLASAGPNTRTSVLVGVAWFARERQTTELVAHEVGHNHGRRHAPCGGAANPDPLYPHNGGSIGVPGTDMYSYSVNGGPPPVLSPFSNFDIMSYCTPAWISDYNYEALLAARLAADPLATTAGAGPFCECLIVWGSVAGDSITIHPAFVTRTRPHLPAKSGAWKVEGVLENGGTAFSHAFEPAEIDHAPGVRHFTFAIPLKQTDREVLAQLRVAGPGRVAAMTRLGSSGAETMRLEAGTAVLRRAVTGARTILSWPVGSFRAALVRNPATGAVLGISTDGTLALDARLAEVDVTLSDGVRSYTVSVRLER